jgi:hypothetical protein
METVEVKRNNMKELERIKVLEDELALLKADLMKVEEKKEPVAICGTLGFLVHPTELGKMTWEEAKKACASLGKGWRLPTRVELLLMYENKDVVGGFADNYYWSSTEANNYTAWIQYFGNGVQYNYNKDNEDNVRAVKTI